MRLFVLVLFWLYVAGFIVRVILASKDPGKHVGYALLSLAFALWAGVVLWTS